ncbi:MAG TPA: alpha/beta fold hydrolase [Solirubrobacterales bacterium]|nr:alpha/beta fold hydrolase [Solirubrobacterales bacterium]
MSFTPPPPGASREELEAALAAPTSFLREASGLNGGEPIPGLADCDLEAALDGARHEFVRHRGLAVHLEIHEAARGAPTVVIHHGLGDHVRRFTPLAGMLAEAGFNTVALDRPGHGLSQGHRGHCPLPWALDLVDSSVAFARSRFGGPVILLGDSLGGITLWYALTLEVDADAVLCHCIGHPEVDLDSSMRWKQPLMKASGTLLPKAPIPVRHIADYDEVALEPATQKAFDSERDDVFNFKVTAGSAASYIGFRPGIPWARVTTPAAVWIGAEDRMVTPEFTRRSYEREHPPGAELDELAGMGHQVFLDHLAAAFPRFLDWTDRALA